ncbi:unnamed protein product [Closterium sp. NIES-53]
MATLDVLTFYSEGHPIEFNAWLDDLQLFLLTDYKDGTLLFDLISGATPAPDATTDSATRSQAVRLCHSSRSSHSPRTSDTHYRAVLPAEFLAKNPPPMYITLYFIVTRLPDSLSAVRDLLLALDPTDLTVDLLEKHLLAAETSIVTVGASRGTPRTPFFEGCSPRSPPVLTKHIALRYFLARELQQHGQLRLVYVASQANTADIFTKALQPCDHQSFCTVRGLVPTWPHVLTS